MHDSKAFLASVYETVRSRDIDELVDHFSEDCVFVDVPLAETAQGRDAFRAYMEETFRGLPDFQPESWAFVAEGQNVAAELVLRGTHEGPFMGHGPTHREIRWRASAFYSLSPSLDQVMREVYYYDLASLEAQLGSDRA